VGGGIRTREYARQLLQSGADKVVICSNALRVPSFVHELASEFGSQAIVVIIDYRRNGGDTFVYSNRGKTLEKIGIFEVIEEMQSQGAGEIVLQNIDLEGSKHGLDIKVIAEVQDSIEIPLIISGGAGNFEHLRSALEIPIVSGVACGSLFYFGDNSPIRARAYLRNHGIPMRKSK
jgi:cyclase